MSLTYAIADLHGRYDLLGMAFEKIAAHAAGKQATIITMGDYIDRGQRSREIIEKLMAGDPAPNLRLVCLQGNHEQIMLICCAAPGRIEWWVRNGGGATLISYGNPVGDFANPSLIPIEHLRWAFELPKYYEDAHRIFVHAGVKDGVKLGDQDDEILLWMLYPDGDKGGYGSKHVVHGHHQFENGPLLFSGRTDLDTFAWWTGRLVVGVFDDELAGGPIELISIVGPTFRELRDA